MRILVTGATGYVGGRLIPRLLERGHQVRVFVRDPRRIAGRAWAADVEVVSGDMLDPASVAAAVAGVDAAYYL
ncbi:MAG: NAD(P)H-binding protein, partial [Caldilineaceae bacterium]|nr:NAD(P)H-binding protein [Caldilineaceae bacterium]